MSSKLEKLHWFFLRWQAMRHPVEEIYRLRQFLRNHLLDRVSAGTLPSAPRGFSYKDRTGIEYSRIALAQLQPARSPIHRFPLLNLTISDLGMIRDWRKDPKSGKSSPIKFCGDLDAQDFDLIGDIKYVAVLSRLHFLPFYAIDAVVHYNQASMKFIERTLSDWNLQNPYLSSINWKTGIEMGIRVLNLVVSRKILSLGEPDPVLLDTIDQSIYSCFHYLMRHKSRYSSANNHLVAELLGLIAVLAHYDHPDHRRILQRTARMFIRELFVQNNSDGGNREQSIQYQVEVLDAWLIGLHMLRGMDYDFDRSAVNNQLYHMGEFLRHFMFEDGTLIRVGDDDEGQYLFPYHNVDYVQSLSVLNSLRLFLHDSPTDANGNIDLRIYLMGGKRWASNDIWRADTNGSRTQLPSRLFPETGYAFFNNQDSRLVMDVGEIGMRPLAAHGHSDILSFTLDYKNVPIIVDPGTFQYHGRTPFRQYFRSVKAHNTLSVNGLDQARSGGRMIWLKQPNVSTLSFDALDNVISCEAEHDGFVRQGVSVIHRRHIEYQREKRRYLIADYVIGQGCHEIEIMLHFHPDCSLTRLDDHRFMVRCGSLELQLENPLFQSGELYKGSDSPIMGWYSGGYDKIQACWTLLLRHRSVGDCNINTTIQLL